MCIFISLEIITKSSVQFSHSVVSDSLQPHGLQHARPPCPSPTPRVYSNSCPLSRWCHSTTSSSVIPFSSHLQSFPASGSFQMSQFFTLGSQRIGVSAPYLRTAETSVDYAKAFDCVDHSKLWKILKEIGILDHLTFFLRNLYADQKATVRWDRVRSGWYGRRQKAIVRTGHGPTDWFQTGKGVRQGCIFSPCLFNLYAEYIMRNTGLEEAQAGIKIARRNINNLRYADDTTLMAESEEELKTSWWKWKRRVKKLA